MTRFTCESMKGIKERFDISVPEWPMYFSFFVSHCIFVASEIKGAANTQADKYMLVM